MYKKILGKGVPSPDSILCGFRQIAAARGPVFPTFQNVYAYRFFSMSMMLLIMMMMMMMIRLQELVSVYLDHHPDSITAVNLRACNLFRLVGDHAAAVRYRHCTT